MQSQFEILMQDAEFRKEFAVETFIAECTELLSRVMHEKQISKAELAARLGKSRAWATQLLSGGRNVTVRTLAEVAYELGVELRLESSPIAGAPERSEWNAMGSLVVKPPVGSNRYNVLSFPDPTWKESDSAGAEEIDWEIQDEALLQGRVA